MKRWANIAGWLWWGGIALVGCQGGRSLRNVVPGEGGIFEDAGLSEASGVFGTAGASGVAGTSGAAGVSGTIGAGGIPDVDGNGTGGASGGSEPSPDLNGRWTMIGFEDPLTVGLTQRDGVILGIGCDTPTAFGSVPVPSVPDFADQSVPVSCGAVEHGVITGRHAQFGFEILGHIQVAVDVLAAATGDRMTGTFGYSSPPEGPTAWLRITPLDDWLSSTPGYKDLPRFLAGRAGTYGVTLRPGQAPGPSFAIARVYRMQLTSDFIVLIMGDFGAFSGSEMSWQESIQTLQVGPVPATDPALPVGLALRFDALELVTVEATLPSGAHYVFDVTKIAN